MVRKDILFCVALLLIAAFSGVSARAQEGEIGALPYVDEFGDPIALPPPPVQQQQPPEITPLPEAPDPSPQEHYEEYAPEEFVEEYEEPPPPPPQPVRPVVRPAPRSTPGAAGVRPPQPRQARPATPAQVLPKPSNSRSMDEKSGDEAAEGLINGVLKPTTPVTFDFRDEPLYNVIEGISRLTGRNFDVDPNIAATTVTIITHEEIPPELAYEVLESILSTRGFSMVETLDGKLVKIISTPDATQSEKTPLVRGAQIISDRYDDYATHIISVQFGDAAEISNALKLLGSRNSRIDVYAPTNTLIITDTTDGLKRIFSFLEEVDIPGFDTVMEIYTLEYTRAEVVAQQLEQVLLDAAGPPARAQAPQAQPVRPTPTRTVRPTVPGISTSQVIGSRQETLRMVPDERLNALIVVASEGMMERVRDMVKRLDTPTPYEANNLHIYELLNADAEQVEAAIQPLIGTAPRRTGGGQGAAAPGGAAGATEVQPFEQKVQVTRYDQTNSLLIVASPQDYKLLEAFIARLDVPQRQVLVEAIVMDVTVSDDYGVSVDAAGITGHDGFGLTSTANISKLAAGLGTAADAANQIVGGPGAMMAMGLLGLGSDGGLTAGVFDDIEVEIDGRKVKVPFVPLLFQAIEKISDLEVLSQPSLVTVDNEEASIVVGQEVPFITATSRPAVNQQGEVTGGGYGYGTTRVQREEVGVKLKVTPQVSEGDNVLLQIEIEVSDTDADQIGTVDILGPTTNKSLIQNRVLVKDGATAVLAGLIRDSVSRSRKQAPVLGDLPGLGWLFRSKSSRREKRNMVVLVTPHIVKEGIDLDRVTQYKVNEYHDANIEELLKKNFFKKQDLRKKYRPTFDRSEALTGRRGSANYGRGDIKR